MALIEKELGKPLYTLIHIDWSTKQKSICTYGVDGAILTSNLAELKLYAKRLQAHVTDSRYYYTALVTIAIPKDAYFERVEIKVGMPSAITKRNGPPKEFLEKEEN